MKRYYLGLLAFVALVAGFGLSHAEPTQAGGFIKVQQTNVQLALNIAFYCSGNSMDIVQGSINVAVLNAPDLDPSKISTTQTNVQVGYNFAVNSPALSQGITQDAGNVAFITSGSGATDVNNVQKNLGAYFSVSFQSPGNTQSIQQNAANAVSVQTGSPTLSSAVALILKQQNVALSLQVCAPTEGVANMLGTYFYGRALGTYPINNPY
jgi:hypothetical protein